MIKDIQPPQVTDIGMAIVREDSPTGGVQWNSYLINLKDIMLEGSIVASKGYGPVDKEPRKTSMLRHYIDEVPPNSTRRIETILEEVFGMFNEYWLTFFAAGKMYDRRFIFVPESISVENLTEIP